MSLKLPTVVIVGRPNVGKSTLFNRIVGQRLAVIEDFPGVTRDRLYAKGDWCGKNFTLIDTGGILFSDDDPLINQIRVQAEVALSEADVILFLVDCADGIMPDDHDMANLLRRTKKPIIVVANKADNKKRESNVSDFFALGLGEIQPISSLHGNGVADVLDTTVSYFEEVDPNEIEAGFSVAIVGRPNVGKSSLLNAFTGEKRVIVSDIPGTTRDAIDTLITFKDEQIRLIDTAGLRRKGKIQGTVEYYMALRATRSVERAQCALIIVDGTEGLTDGDKRTAKLAHDFGRSCVIVINKWDQKEPPHGYPNKNSQIKKDFIKIIHNEIPEVNYAPICFTSAKESSGIDRVLSTCLMVLENWHLRISTGNLNKIFQDALYEKPYTRKGKAFKIYYATQVSACPPTFMLFCNNPDLLHFSYKRYLENRLRAQFPMTGTPIRFIIRARNEKDK